MGVDFDRLLTNELKPMLEAHGFKSPKKKWFVRERSAALTDVIELDRLGGRVGNYQVRPEIGIHCPAHHEMEAAARVLGDDDAAWWRKRYARRKYEDRSISAALFPGLGDSPGSYLDPATGKEYGVDPHPQTPEYVGEAGVRLVEQLTYTWNFHAPHLNERVFRRLAESLAGLALPWLESFGSVEDLAARPSNRWNCSRLEGPDGPLTMAHVSDNGASDGGTAAGLLALAGDPAGAIRRLETEADGSDHETYVGRCRALAEVIARGLPGS